MRLFLFRGLALPAGVLSPRKGGVRAPARDAHARKGGLGMVHSLRRSA